MLKLKHLIAAALAALFLSGAAFAEVKAISPTAAGAVATAPWTTGDRITVVTFTNGSTGFVSYHVTVMSSTWQAIDFDCELSPMETTYFIFESFSDTESSLTTECSSGATFNLNIVQRRIARGTEGFVVLQEEARTNALISDFTVIDFAQGYAFSANSWHVGYNPCRTSSSSNSCDNGAFPGEPLGVHDLDFGGRYDYLPGTLAASFIAPDDDVTASVLVYNLNGTPGWPAYAKLSGYVYDDDENPLSGFIDYDCYRLIALSDIFGSNVDRRFGPAGFPYVVGHVTLQARFAPLALAVVPSVGWIIQTIADGGQVNGGNFGGVMTGNAAWARQMLITKDPLKSLFRVDAVPRPIGHI